MPSQRLDQRPARWLPHRRDPPIRTPGSRLEIGPIKQGTVPLTFLNNLQRQAYRLNPAILAVANWAYDNKRTIGKFICDSPRDRLDPFVGDPEAEPDRFKEWKRTQRSIDDHNAQLFQKNWRATETMFVANMYADEPRFWIPWSYDYRGRVYPQNTQLNPQGTDFDKSLLLFADEGPVNEYWLAWHTATTYGRDKDPHDARAQWARDNVELITMVAEDPISNLSLWEEADEPWMFLAAAIEYHACVITKQRHTSGLPIGIDATCSGLQHLASMTRDADGSCSSQCDQGSERRPQRRLQDRGRGSAQVHPRQRDPSLHGSQDDQAHRDDRPLRGQP